MAYIGDPPGSFTIPVTLGADRLFTMTRNDGTSAKNPVNWGATVSMAIDIDKTNPTVITVAVTGSQAVVLIPSTVADQVANSTRWRIYMVTTFNSAPLTTPIAVGNFERDDGGTKQ